MHVDDFIAGSWR